MRRFDVWANFLSPQVKWGGIISNKHGIYRLSHELPNKLRLKNLGNEKMSENSQNFIELLPSSKSSLEMKTLLALAKMFSGSALFHMKTKFYLKCFVNDCLWKQFLAS